MALKKVLREPSQDISLSLVHPLSKLWAQKSNLQWFPKNLLKKRPKNKQIMQMTFRVVVRGSSKALFE